MADEHNERAFGARIAQAPTERAVAAAFMDHAFDLFGAPFVGFYLLDHPRPAEIHTRGVKAAFVDEYEHSARPGDPVLDQVLRTRLPAQASASELLRRGAGAYREFVQRWGCHDYLLVPIVVGGEVVGTMNTAHLEATPFGRRDAERALRLSMDVSNRVAALRALSARSWSRWDGVLTARQLEVAEAATRGFSVAEMARALGVSPNTVKKHLKMVYAVLGVSTRAELSLALVNGPAATERPELRIPRTRRTSTGSPAFVW